MTTTTTTTLFSVKDPEKLAEKEIPITLFLSFLLPPVGYIYTGRQDMCIFMLFFFLTPLVIASFLLYEYPFSVIGSVFVLMVMLSMVFSCFENTYQLFKARLQRWQKNREFNKVALELAKAELQEDGRIIEIVRILREATLGDIVIHTGIGMDKAEQIVRECEKKEFLLAKLRLEDGVTLYYVP
ncbi:hypothetical protein [Halomicronema sp. CCY15110]|uniref:hypothetical protein n=1 Tax=Halomicronema sp. CCY15110 TaxID=2767773 RepID=UPI00194FC061|nr:hypothetical protein [Halomicronema sp. CCY15110]